ncbi:MAG: hypothetical protein ACPL3P_00850 [Anaerolineales bacterium]
MTTAAVLFGLLLSTLYGTLFHFWRGGNFGRLIFYIVLSWFGFWSGNYLAQSFHSNFIKIGTLQVGFATLSAFACMLVGYWLSLIRIETK